MRLAQLILRPFGSFADRTLDFGSGEPDFHIVVGENEAGKSTMLTAIGDLLWKIDERTPFSFRYDYGELRIGGTVEHDGERLEFFRRKSRTNQLLSSSGVALPDDALASFLGGLDREGFDRMFGLDHQRLRIGGREMLEGREDVARVLFEAGTGMVGVGRLLDELEREAEELFTGQARNKPLNLAIKEVEANAVAARGTSLAPAKWKALVQATEEAQQAHDIALARSAELESFRAALERDQRVRPILQKIETRQAELAELGELPSLARDAAQIRDRTRSGIREATISLEQTRTLLDEERASIALLAAPSPLLPLMEEVQRLSDQVSLYRSHVTELAQDQTLLTEVDRKNHRDLEESANGAPPPSRALVSAARTALDRVVELGNELTEARRRVSAAERAVNGKEAELTQAGSATGMAALKVAVDAAPRNVARTVQDYTSRVVLANSRLQRALAQLAPWSGTIEELGRAASPPQEIIEQHKQALKAIADRRSDLLKSLDDAEKLTISSATALAELQSSTGELPTTEAIEAARLTRNDSIRRLPAADDPDRELEQTFELVRSADRLADRQGSEAARLAEFARARADAEQARLLKEAHERSLQLLGADEEHATGAWKVIWTAAGFTQPVTPSEFLAWSEARAEALIASDDLTTATGQLASHNREVASTAANIERLLGAESEKLDFDDLVRLASARLGELQATAELRASLGAQLTTLREALSEGQAHVFELEASSEQARNELVAATKPLGLDAGDLAKLDQLLATFEAVLGRNEEAAETRQRAEARADDVKLFEEDVAALAEQLGEELGDNHATYVTGLRQALANALAIEAERAQRQGRIEDLEGRLGGQEHALQLSQSSRQALFEAAQVSEDEALDEVIARCERARVLHEELAALRDELAEAGGGLDEGSLRTEVSARAIDDVVRQLAEVQAEQASLVPRVSALATALAEATAAERQAAAGECAIVAAQATEAARATVGQLAERYIKAQSAAAILRWSINRHRETRQAPLLSRAGVIFAEVTGGRFTGLKLDWSRSEDPVIVAERPGGERCGVDQLSEGTRDQLFLAFRLAAIEERAAVHAMPLVCDDLLITADDGRASRLLKQLAELSRSTQVICFTHHQHLVRIAEEAIGSDAFRLHSVEPA